MHTYMHIFGQAQTHDGCQPIAITEISLHTNVKFNVNHKSQIHHLISLSPLLIMHTNIQVVGDL